MQEKTDIWVEVVIVMLNSRKNRHVGGGCDRYVYFKKKLTYGKAPPGRQKTSICIVFYDVFCNAYFFEAKPIQRNTFSNTAVAQLLQDSPT